MLENSILNQEESNVEQKKGTRPKQGSAFA
jgi:hypothetical protein